MKGCVDALLIKYYIKYHGENLVHGMLELDLGILRFVSL